ncbi:hypothetical protein Anapl_15302 [Anas platyrhynchos]|uniref:Uncharacterized protein n=1 Tax=Anas platyrhynchos TaxID=8839 RepID=R0LG80_ANAPL|nr:hypothetical protein Anapl_15302 [Anas platyrhynchos]
MLSLYYPNSLTFIANLTGADSVSHKINGQKHSDKQLQENNPLVISSRVDSVLEDSCWQQYFLNSSFGRCGNTVMGTSHSHPGSLVYSAAASHGLLAVSKIPQHLRVSQFESTPPLEQHKKKAIRKPKRFSDVTRMQLDGFKFPFGELEYFASA